MLLISLLLLLVGVVQCRVGDIVRATSAMTMQMVYPTMNIMFGGERQQQQHAVWFAMLLHANSC
jgi:hypothetical protein